MRRLVPVLAVGLAGLVLVGLALAAHNRNYSLHLRGALEVPALPIETRAQGQAIFHLSKDGQSLAYKLNVANIRNVFMAHIHCGSPAVAGPIVVWLYPSTTPGAGPIGAGRIQGRIATGTITGANVIPIAPSAVCPGGIANFADLIAKLNSGLAYVNVHTSDGTAVLRPGNYPAGELRGNF